MLKFFKQLFGIFRSPKERVRLVSLKTNDEVWGEVEDRVRYHNPWTHETHEYWTVKWEGKPIWETFRSHDFIWTRGAWTLIR